MTYLHKVTFYPDTDEEAEKKMQPIVDLIEKGDFMILINGKIYKVEPNNILLGIEKHGAETNETK